EADRYVVSTDTGKTFRARFLVMATGQLSLPRKPDFAGLDDFTGEWAQTSQWRPVRIKGRRVGGIRTGSSGVQSVTAVSREAAQTYVFQRTAHYSLPVHNGPANHHQHDEIAADVRGVWQELLNTVGGAFLPPPVGKAGEFTPEQQQAYL